MSSTLLFTHAGALSDANKVSTSPPWGDGLRSQSRSLPRLGPWVRRIRSPLHHLAEVACELNLGDPFGSSHYYPETIPVQSALGTLIWGSLIQSVRLIVVRSLGARAIILR